MSATFDVFKKYGAWHWTLTHSNGKILAQSTKGYKEKSKAKRAVQSVVAVANDAEIREIVGRSG